MTRCAAVVAAVCGLVTLLSPACPAAPGLSLQATAEGDGEYMVGESIFVELTFRGETEEPVTIDLGHLGRWALSVTAAGQTHTSGYLETCPGGISASYETTLQRGKTYRHRLLLNEWVSFTQPGEQQVAISYDSTRSPRGKTTNLKADCELTFGITPKDPEQLTKLLRQLHETRRETNMHTLALCYCGQEEALPLLRALIQESHAGGGVSTELLKGVRRVGTLAALDLLADLMNSPQDHISHMAMVEVGLIERDATDPKVKARAQELMKQIPEGFTFAEPAILD
jgi:hypothetical protein